jgi:hypothetical protein
MHSGYPDAPGAHHGKCAASSRNATEDRYMMVGTPPLAEPQEGGEDRRACGPSPLETKRGMGVFRLIQPTSAQPTRNPLNVWRVFVTRSAARPPHGEGGTPWTPPMPYFRPSPVRYIAPGSESRLGVDCPAITNQTEESSKLQLRPGVIPPSTREAPLEGGAPPFPSSRPSAPAQCLGRGWFNALTSWRPTDPCTTL